MKTIYNFDVLEDRINVDLKSNYQCLKNDESKIQHYASLFDRTVEEGFYNGGNLRQGEGEIATWEPNPAYMNSLEELWIGIPEILNEYDLAMEKSLRELFFESREYKDYTVIHRRVFMGQIVNSKNNKAVTMCILTVPHSHSGFEYVIQPSVHISKFIDYQSQQAIDNSAIGTS